MSRVVFLWGLLVVPTLGGCTPAIGDSCNQSSDCSSQGNRVCDTAQPDGYCTILGCTGNGCPDNAACVMFGTSVSGCAANDYDTPSRVSFVLCMKHCSKDSDCRQDEGYACRNPRGLPWDAVILDDNQSQDVCIVPTPSVDAPSPASFDAAVCTPTAPFPDAVAADASDDGG